MNLNREIKLPFGLHRFVDVVLKIFALFVGLIVISIIGRAFDGPRKDLREEKEFSFRNQVKLEYLAGVIEGKYEKPIVEYGFPKIKVEREKVEIWITKNDFKIYSFLVSNDGINFQEIVSKNEK